MLTIYFSGTGNSEYIARQFSEQMGARCHSIEEKLNFEELFSHEETVAVCYPIYGSLVPRIMREFVKRHCSLFAGKKLIVFCTQMCFSGDGARAFLRLLPECEGDVLYAEHFNMPNNICNLSILPIREGERRRKKKAADRKLQRVCRDIRSGVVKKRGWSAFAAALGRTQNVGFSGSEERGRGSFAADGDCTGCGLCVKICPMHNLELQDGKVKQRNNCTLCYRCVNQCPQMAATVLLSAKPKRQYMGITPREPRSDRE